MEKCDMNAINAYANGTFVVSDLYSFKRQKPSKDIDIGGVSDLKEIKKTDEGDYIRVNFTRLLDTGDQYDAVLIPNKNMSFIVAWTEGELESSYHGPNKYRTDIMLTVNGIGGDPTSANDVYWDVHGIGMFVAWNLFVTIGYIAARFLKHYSWWTFLHLLGGTVPALFSVGIIIAAIVKRKESSDVPVTNSIHVIYGLTFFGVLIIQIALGFISFFGIYKAERVNSNRLLKLKKLHKYLGMFLFFSSNLQIITGFLMLYPKYYGIPVALCTLSISLVAILEIMNFQKNKSKTDLITKSFQEANEITQLKNFTLTEILDEKHNTKFVLYENLLLDVTNFSENHPGGKNLIKENLFSDISRYITGNQAFSSKIPAHDHNAQTCIYAIKSLAYAKFTDNHAIVLKNEKTSGLNNEMVFEFKASVASVDVGFAVSESICELVFSNDEFKFPIFLSGINWLGRHFAVSSYELNKTRYYSLCLCLNKTIQERIIRLFDNVRSLEENKVSIEIAAIKESESFSSNISFYIKKYEYEGALSAYLHNIRPATLSRLNIRGPIGIGLGLGQKLNGTHILVAGGTGILPYLDFAFYIIRYMVDKISKTKFNNEKNKIDENETFSEVNEDFKLILFASYSTKDSALMHEILLKANSFDKKWNLNKFDYYMRSSEDEKWNKGFLQAALENVSKQETHLHLCGPVGFMEFMKSKFIETGKINVENICFT